MSKKVLVDTNIFLDYYLNRQSGVIPIGEFAFQFFRRAATCEFFVIVCVETVNEISRVLGVGKQSVEEDVFEILKEKHKIEIILPCNNQKAEALRVSGEKALPYNDSLFAVVARDLGIEVVTRDKHFFDSLDFVKSFLPEEL